MSYWGPGSEYGPKSRCLRLSNVGALRINMGLCMAYGFGFASLASATLETKAVLVGPCHAMQCQGIEESLRLSGRGCMAHLGFRVLDPGVRLHMQFLIASVTLNPEPSYP